MERDTDQPAMKWISLRLINLLEHTAPHIARLATLPQTGLCGHRQPLATMSSARPHMSCGPAVSSSSCSLLPLCELLHACWAPV